MTQETIRQQIEAIRQASADARKSPESARQFLIAAGIIKREEVKLLDKKQKQLQKRSL